jgi:hypothetical protein
MKHALITVEITIMVNVDDSTTKEEATDIALFECEAIGNIKGVILDKMKGREVTSYCVNDFDWLDI